MQRWRVLSTSAVMVAIGGCAAAVLSFAAAQPAPPGGQPRGALPAATTACAISTYPVSSAKRRPAASSSARPVSTPASTRPTTAAAPRPHRPAPSTTTPVAPHKSPSTARPAPSPTSTQAPRPVTGEPLPLGYSTGTATRILTVVAARSSSTAATLQAWYRAPGGGWLRYQSPVSARLGSAGLTSQPSESLSATPIGSFTLTEAFGALADPGTALPYFQTTPADWWISQAGPLYNTHQRCSSGCAFTQGVPNEHLRYETPYYNYALVIDYNRFPVRPGAGSAFFLHVTDGAPTAGCVAIPQSALVNLMRWLSPGTHPRILIGVS